MEQVTEIANSNFSKAWGEADNYAEGSEEYQTMLQALKRFKKRLEGRIDMSLVDLFNKK